jgi:nitroreductase
MPILITEFKIFMNSIELLTSRQSNAALIAPAPSEKDLSTILAAGARVPDHAALMPWHITVVKEQGLQRLSDLFMSTLDMRLVDEAKKEKTKKMPFRAPMIFVISSQYVAHPKVPKQEQLITAGCCAHAMQMAAFALGYGAMWRTGELAYNKVIKAGLGIKQTDDIVGFLYIGSNAKDVIIKSNKDISGCVSYF